MNFRDITMFLRISFLVIVIACFVESFVIGPSKNSVNDIHFPSLSHAFVRSGGEKKECPYSKTTYLGKKVDGQLLTCVTAVDKKSSKVMMWKKTTATVTCPLDKKDDKCPITEIQVENQQNECKCRQTTIRMNDGGIGYNHFNMSITTEGSCANQHKVLCYTKC